MYVIREVMQCHPGKVRPMVEKFKKIADAIDALDRPGTGDVRISTDVAGAAFWTVTFETEIDGLDAWFELEKQMMGDEKLASVMADYHDLVAGGRREIWRRER